MKNVFLNVRTAKAQAGCAKVTKSSRMAKILTTLTLLLTLGFGQMWAGAGFYEVYFTYSYSGTTSNATYTNSTSTTQTIDLGTLTADFKITSIYLKYWKDGSGNMCGGLVDYYISSDQEYQPSWTWTPKGGNNHELSSTANWTIAQYNTGASGSYTFWYRFKTWGSSSSSSGCSDNYYIPTNSNNKNKFTYNIAPPAVSGFGVSTSGFLAGSGTSSDPYLVKSGNSLTFTVSGSKARTDANSTFKYWLNSGTKKTSGTLSTGSITSTSLQSATIHGQCINNSSSSLVGTESTSTIYYKAVSVKDISVYIYVGGRTSAEINSVEMNGCTPYVGTKALSSVKINNQSAGAPKFTLSGNWLVYTFEDVTKVSNITCARSGGNIFTGEITDNVYYMYDGTELDSQCVPRANPTWGTAPASGAIGGSMTATVSGAPAGATITWSSTNTSAATVNSRGVISYVAAGNTTIKARVQKAAGGDYCELDYTLSQDISVTSGATVTATRACPEYVSSNSGQVKLDISSTGASTGWYYRVCNSTKTAYYAPEEQSAASNTLSWTMNGSLPTGSNTLVVELYNSARQLVCTSSSVTVNVEIAESVTISAGANGSVSPSGIVYANNNHVHPTITATPNEHYNFVNWTSSYPSSAWVASATSATTTVTATASGYTITANFAGDQYSIEYYDQGGSAFSGTQTNPPTTHTYGTATTLKTPTKTGFTFGGWYTNSACTGASVSSLGATAYTANINLYAKWTEVMSTLTTSCHYDAGDPSYAVPTKSVSSIGISTTSNLVATAPGTGYTFVGWTLTHCVRTSGAANSRTITVRSDGSGEAASAVANYEEVLTSTYYVVGDNRGPFTDGWTANANTMMMKRTGYSTSSDVYWELEVPASKTSPGNDQWEFKIYNDASTTGEKWYGWGNTDNYWLTKANNNLTLSTTGSKTIYLKCYVEGTYTFHVNYSTPASPTLEVSWPVVNQLRISSASPTDATNTNNFDLTDKGSNNWEVKRTLNANTTYTFKMVFDGAWYGDGTAFTRSNTSATGLTDGDNMTIKTDVAGEYTFTFNSSSKNLDITYPTAYTVTYGVGTSYTSMGSVSTSPSVTSGNYVIAGTSIRFTATPNLGYKFVGWYREAACTNQVSTSNPYDLTINATTKLYAKFEVRNLYIHADWLSWGTAQMTQSTVNRAVYTYEIDNVAAAATSASSPYNNGYHFRFMNANNAGDDYLAYNYNGVQTPTGSGFLTNSDIHKTADRNPTIQYNLTHKSHITITLTLRSIDDATKPTVNIAADPYYTISTAKAGTGTAGVSISPSSVEARSGANSPTIAATISPGYSFVNWTATSGITINSSGSTSTTVRATTSGTLTANVNANTYDINLNANGGSGAAKVVTVTYAAGMPSKLKSGADLTAHSRTGYNFAGYYDHTSTGTQYYTSTLESARNWDKTTAAPLYAHWTAKTYTITLTQSGETGYGSSGTASVTATYDAALPTIASLPTAAQGYAFMGYYTGHNGTGTQYYGPTGNKLVATYTTAGGIELFAYFKKAEITDITLDNYMFDPVAAGGTGFVIANPTVEPTPVLPVKICWELLYDNGNSVPAGHEAIDDHDGSHPDRVKFSIAGLAAGGYKIKATLRTGDDCSGGTLLSSFDKSFTIASGYTVTIQYKDSEGNTIAPSTTSPGKATDWTSISAPTIVGYNFSTWVPGDGITLESSATTNSNRFKATFNGTLTARYTKKRVIYFNNTLGWSNVYVYFYSGEYWDGNKGTGSQTGGTYTGKHGRMQPVSEGSKIYYFDAEGASVDASYTYVAFTELEQTDYQYFAKTIAAKNKVAYRGDYNSTKLPMFVPLADQTPVSKNTNLADYYNEGYWMNYPENTGYTLRIYNRWNADNATGASREYMIPFSTDKKMPLKQDVEINFSGETWFLIYRNDGNYLQGSHTFMQNDHGDKAMTSTSNAGTASKMKVISDAEGIYTFTLSFHGNGANPEVYSYYVNVEFPAAVGDYRIVYQDNATWSQSTPHDASWNHPSRVIPKIKVAATEAQKDTVSFFISVGSSPTMKFQKIESINATTGAVTWTDVASGSITIPSSITESGVYNFIVTQPVGGASISLEKAEPYTGNFYIRTDGAGSTKWDNYQASDHQMTYTEFSMSAANSFGDKYSHYFMHWSPGGTNIKFVVANDYSPCISDTLENDLHDWGNLNAGGQLKKDGNKSETEDIYSANVRFMYNYKTNKISRAYVASSTNAARKFLVLRGNQVIKGEDGSTAINDQSVTNGAILSDKENWIYERILYINPGTRFKLFACYAEATPTEAGAQYFRGAYDSNNFTTDANSVILISGTGGYQKARILYDFKTNRLVCAWLPSDEPIDEPLDIDADVMVIRDHQEAAECITFSGSGSKLTDVKTVYGVMKFNRWTLNNRYRGKGGVEDNNKDHCDSPADIAEYHGILPAGEQKSVYERSLYFISFPFDVKVSEIFGFGTYGKHWILEYYDGLNRAKNGYWIDSPANWKYVTPSMAKTYELKAYEGYILCLSLGRMAYDNTEVWPNNISNVELYFPSKTPMTNIQTTNVNISGLNEIAGDPYRCTINREGEDGDRRVKDSYWRCLGVPSYDMYAGTLTSDGSTVINWQTDYSTFPFLYAWNMNDNTLTPQSTNRFSFKPMHAYLTQIGTAIYWTNVSATPAVMARQTEEPTEYNWCLTLNAGEQMIDQTYVRMSTDEVITNEFDFGQDLSKELNTGRSDIYSFIGNERAAANSLQMNIETTTVVRLGLNIEATGDYTFSIPDGTNGVGITLIDEETGIRTSLSALDYTVELAAGDYTERFWLEISPVKGTETGIDPGVDARENGVRKVLIDGILYIVRDGKMYDATGKRVE